MVLCSFQPPPTMSYRKSLLQWVSWFVTTCLCVQDDEVVLQCSATIHKEQQKLCLAAEGFGNRLCFLESISNSKVLIRALILPFVTWITTMPVTWHIEGKTQINEQRPSNEWCKFHHQCKNEGSSDVKGLACDPRPEKSHHTLESGPPTSSKHTGLCSSLQ